MKKTFFVMTLVLGIGRPLCAVSLDGTTTVIYQTSSYAFANGDFARGFVRLNAGFSVGAGSIVSLNLLAPVGGDIDLNDTGKITLEGDLALQSNATFSKGGIINGQGYSVLMNGNLKIPTGRILQFSSDTVIDGQGHMLRLSSGSPGGQILIDGPDGTKVTLRNMTLNGARLFSDGTLSIGFGIGNNQTLVLENVTLQLSQDFFFYGGNLEIKGNVKIMGKYLKALRPDLQPALFIFISPYDCVIQKDSTLTLDPTMAFVYAPLDHSNKHVIMNDESSQLFLNGTALFAPGDTGLQLTTGHIIVNHRNFFQGTGVNETTKAIQFGDGKIAHDIALNMYPGARIEVADAIFRYKNQQ